MRGEHADTLAFDLANWPVSQRFLTMESPSLAPDVRSESRLIVGIDLDHTLVSYARGLQRWAEALGVVADEGISLKDAVRHHCWASPEGDLAWQRVQADIYGHGMKDAALMPGAREFLCWLADMDIPVVVVSHKTAFAAAAPEGPNLRETALTWMEAQGLFTPETGLTKDRVYFASTRAKKVAQIAALGCTHFIDDLTAVFLELGFPKDVHAVFFAPEWAGEVGDWEVARSWEEVHRILVKELGAVPDGLPAEIDGTPVVNVTPLHGGRNSSVYRLDCADGACYAAKCFASAARMTRESEALRYLNARGIPSVPSVSPSDSPPVLVCDYVAGMSPVTEVSSADIDAAIDFIRTLNTPPFGSWTRPAAEAFFRLDEVLRNVQDRLTALDSPWFVQPPLYEELSDFISGTLVRLMHAIPRDASWQEVLPQENRVLSPSDFGFHNAVRRPDGTLVFLDFEYFGWDDPAKLISDFCWHPAMELSTAQKRQLASGIAKIVPDRDMLLGRLPVAYPLFGLKWCTILLNEFLPHHWERRKFAGDERPREMVLAEQLQKARGLAARMAGLQGVFPYLD